LDPKVGNSVFCRRSAPRGEPEAFFFANIAAIWRWHASCSAFPRVSEIFLNIRPLNQALDFHLERHNLLAANVAHVDTPGFVPRDVERTAATDFAQVLNVAVERTNPGHLQGAGGTSLNGRIFEDRSAGGGADGNFVSLDREASKLAANQLRYDLVSVLVKGELSGLMDAAGDMQR
jgi:flagellar basal-body rod protein FlgB